MSKQTFWKTEIDVYGDGVKRLVPTYRVPVDAETLAEDGNLCEHQGSDDIECSTTEQFWTGVWGDVSIVLCKPHLDAEGGEQITEDEYNALGETMDWA